MKYYKCVDCGTVLPEADGDVCGDCACKRGQRCNTARKETVVGGDPRFLTILDEMRALHIKKAYDYSAGEDQLGNVRSSEAFGVPAWVGCMIRGHDKIIRIQNMAKKGKLANESVEDSLIDLANYAVLALILFRETKNG